VVAEIESLSLELIEIRRLAAALDSPDILNITVKPGSRRPGLSTENGVLVLRVRERAIEGAANEACVRALAAAYGVSPSAVALVSGFRRRRKRFAIRLPDASKGCR
jgi:uncharacterized protein YggU (UPF0235/DUF167 family)